MGRKPAGAKQVRKLDGSDYAKSRAEIVLKQIIGEIDIETACELLHVEKSSFHKLRERSLQEFVNSYEPRPAGRPAKVVPPLTELDVLKAENEELEMELKISRARENLALIMRPRKKNE